MAYCVLCVFNKDDVGCQLHTWVHICGIRMLSAIQKKKKYSAAKVEIDSETENECRNE